MSASIIQLPVTRRWTWPDWPDRLYEDAEGFGFDGDRLDRNVFDRCVRVVGDSGPALLSDLVEDGVIDMAWPDMSGVVAAVWAASTHSPSALTHGRWVELFRANGYTEDGRPATHPGEPIRAFRGCVPLVRYFDRAMRLVETDDRGRPVDPDAVIEVLDTRLDLAWTTDLPAARRFARQCLPSRVGQVYAATVEPEFVSARIGSDLVVDPAGLRADDLEPIEIAAAVTR